MEIDVAIQAFFDELEDAPKDEEETTGRQLHSAFMRFIHECEYGVSYGS